MTQQGLLLGILGLLILEDKLPWNIRPSMGYSIERLASYLICERLDSISF